MNNNPFRRGRWPFVILFGFMPLLLGAQPGGEDLPWHRDPARLSLASVNALVVDQQSSRVLYERGADTRVPIASITKLMTAMVVLDAEQALDEKIPVHIENTRELQGVFSRVRKDSHLTRRELLLITLMSSENRAAAALAHHYAGGYEAFIAAMNAKALALGMGNTQFVEPTGLSSDNISTARDLAKLVSAAADYPLIKEFSTNTRRDTRFSKPRYTLAFANTNPLLRNDNWDIEISKTGYTRPAGQCLVMLANIEDRPVALVLLDSFGKLSPMGDANRVKRWLQTGEGGPVPAAARDYVMRKKATTTFAEASCADDDGDCS